MVNFNSWMQQDSPIDESARAARAWNLIQRNPSQITILRNSTVLSVQTVRVGYSNTERTFKGSSADGAVRDAVIFGVRNHPDEDVSDTNIRRGDMFELNGQEFKVINVVYVPGSLQAYSEAVS